MPAIPDDETTPLSLLSLLSPRNLLSSLRASASASGSTLSRRQNTIVAIPSVYKDLNSGPDAGTVVGIVLGSVVGFLLIVWLIYSLTITGGGNDIAGEEEVVVRRPRSRRSRRSVDVREVSRSPRPARIIVEERRTSVAPPPPPPPVERRVSGDDIVEVIEEHSTPPPPPRRKRSARNSGYRAVDPDAYAGGNYPQHPVRGARY